ncbi:MAG: tetratricopeptide repeat protein [Gemmatimonadota bacterium]|nr:MAG: tetratricopeptide repeat protein [Gemmatimonadota bacterium]
MTGKTRRSLQELSAEVATNPGSTAFVELAEAYRERGDTERALRLCLRGLQRHPTHAAAHYELGRIYEARSERELALDEFGIVRQLAPDHLPGRLAIARLYLEEGRLEDAERELNRAGRLGEREPAIAALRKELAAARAEEELIRASAPEPERRSLATLAEEHPGTLGILLVDGDGQLIDGEMKAGEFESGRMLAVTLSGARKESERVASHLQLGKLKRIVIESPEIRLTVSPATRGFVVVAARGDSPPGQAELLLRRARELSDRETPEATG